MAIIDTPLTLDKHKQTKSSLEVENNKRVRVFDEKDLSEFFHDLNGIEVNPQSNSIYRRLSPDFIIAMLRIGNLSPNLINGEFSERRRFQYFEFSIDIIDYSMGAFDKDLENYEYIFVSHPSTIYILPKGNKHEAEWLSAAWSVIGSPEHISASLESIPEGANLAGDLWIESISEDLWLERIREYPIAIVGSGTVGMWTLKALVSMGFRNIHIYEHPDELVSLSNLPRLPLTQHHIDMPKLHMASSLASHTNPLMHVEIHGSLDDTTINNLEDRMLVVLALDETNVQADIHEFCSKAEVDVIQTTDLGLGSHGQMFNYSEGSEILNGKLDTDELREGGDAIIKLLGLFSTIFKFDPETLRAFKLYGEGHFGHLPQTLIAALITSAITATIAWKNATGQSVTVREIFLDPDLVTTDKRLHRFLRQLADSTHLSQVLSKVQMLRES